MERVFHAFDGGRQFLLPQFLEERRKGEWWIFIQHKGIRKAKKIGKNKKLAFDVAAKIEAKLVLGDLRILDEKSDLTFKHYSDSWVETTLPATCKSSTVSDYKGLLNNHILPVFKKLSVIDITRLTVRDFLLKKINDGYAYSTVIHMKNAISGILNQAVDDEVISSNPAHKIGKLSKSVEKTALLDPLTRHELKIFLDKFKKHYPKHYPLALTLARTGMRLGESLGLQWGDIDFLNRFITINRNIARSRIETPKSGKIRKIDMSLQLAKTLKDLRHVRKIETVKKGWGELPDWVFIYENGGFLDGSNWRRRIFNKALEKAKLRKIRIHDLRHTYASLLIQAGES